MFKKIIIIAFIITSIFGQKAYSSNIDSVIEKSINNINSEIQNNINNIESTGQNTTNTIGSTGSSAINTVISAFTPTLKTIPYGGCLNQNSCTNEDNLGKTLVEYFATLGTYTAIANNLNMCDPINGEGKEVDLPGLNGKGIRCQLFTDDIRFVYKDSNYTMKVNDTAFLDDFFQVQVVAQDDKLCLQVLTLAGYMNVGCKYSAPPDLMPAVQPICFAGQSCADKTKSYSHSFLPASSLVVQCVSETINSLFYTNSACQGQSQKGNPFVNVQNGMRTIVKLLITLYVIFFGIRVALGQEIPKKGEVFIFMIKAILVMYCSVGIQNSSTGQYDDGITTYIYPLFMGIGESLSNIIIQSGNGNNLCEYPSDTYERGYSYLAVWDALDCRVSYYLGITNPATLGAVALIAPAIFTVVFAIFFSFQIIVAIMLVIFSIFIISFAIFFVNIYIVSIIAVAILLYFAPIFVPMALFKATKGYYDSWLRLTFGYALQPVVIMAFITLLFTIFDNLYYEGCNFTNVSSPSKPNFVISNPNDALCSQSFGYQMSTLVGNVNNFNPTPFLLFTVNVFVGGNLDSFISKIFVLILFLFLFYHFASIIATFAADLTGSTSLGGMAISPNKIVDVAKAIAMAVADRYTGGTASKVSAVVDKAADGVTADKNESAGRPNAANAGVSATDTKSGEGPAAKSGHASKPLPPLPGGRARSNAVSGDEHKPNLGGGSNAEGLGIAAVKSGSGSAPRSLTRSQSLPSMSTNAESKTPEVKPSEGSEQSESLHKSIRSKLDGSL